MKKLSLLVAGLFVMPAVHAENLLQVYRAALSSDPVYASARAARNAGLESMPQGMAALLPVISATANTQMNDYNIGFRGAAPDSPREGNTYAYNVNLTQPLFNWQSFMVYREAGFKVAQAEATFGQAAQDLIVRVSQAYFDVLGSQDSLAFIRAQKTAISEQLAQAKRNFEVGTATIVDTHEAQSRYDLVVSQEIAAENDLEIKRQTLRQIIGILPKELTALKPQVVLVPPEPSIMDKWVAAAEQTNFAVQGQAAAVEVADREVERLRAGHYPTVNLVANVGQNSSSLSTVGLTSTATDTTYRTIGIQLAIPLYAGGSVGSQVRQAMANREKARQDLENARRTAALSARQSYLGVTNGTAQVKALDQALVSSQSSLESNKLGYEVGVRINIDVLNAQQQLFSTKRDLSKARYDTIMAGLKLRAASGTLGEEDVQRVNALLGK
jgi:outer membrane protein